MSKPKNRWLVLFFLPLLVALAPLSYVGPSASAQQTDRFTADVELYPEELTKVLRGQLSKGEDDTLKLFIDYWQSDSLTLEHKQQCIVISNALNRKTLASTRHFYTLAKIYLEYPHNNSLQREFNSWIQGLELMALSPTVSMSILSQFLSNSYALFTRNVFFVNPAFFWKASKGSYSIHVDSTVTIHFNGIDLSCSTGSDSIVIKGTTGVYIPEQSQWQGKGGKVTWTRSLLPEDEIFAQLSNYTISLTRNDYEADSVWFHNSDYFRQPVIGKLKDKLTRGVRPENIVFPEFHTYERRHSIKNLFQGVDFDGGFYMLGAQFIGSGTIEDPATIEIKRGGDEFLRVTSRIFVFRRQLIQSDLASVRMRFDLDSMFHAGLGFTYNDAVRTVAISPTSMLTTQSPISSSYHNFSISFNQITWNIDRDSLIIGPTTGSSQGRALFESNNFFNEAVFDRLMGPDDQHPLFAIANYTRRVGSRSFEAEGFSRFMRKSVEQTRVQLMRMAMQGYLYYDAETGNAQALPKLYDALRARGELIDYDVIRFISVTENREANAIMDLNSLDMHVSGVANVSVSDSQNVALEPARNQLILKKDRSFSFDGRVRAGLFTFRGEGFYFNYENFRIDLDSVEIMNINYQIDEYDAQGQRVMRGILNSLESISGELLIDKANNKSGLQRNPQYPIFRSTKNSYVYYDAKSILGGVYSRDNFYFELYPFVFESINNFRASDVSFTGMLFSADIFSPLEDTLVVRPDNSLGFVRQVPPEGYPIYQGKGMYYNRIDLSNRGLRGHGDFSYITSTTSSENFYFYPDSLLTQSYAFRIDPQTRGIEYPEVTGGVHSIRWYPYSDELYASRGREPFQMFAGRAALNGNLALNPLGLTGDGQMDLRKAKMGSNHYTFNNLNFAADTANLVMTVPNQETVALRSPKLKAYVDFKENRGEFYRIGESIFADLEAIMYHSHLDEFTWDIRKDELTMATPAYQQAAEMQRFHVRGMVDRDSIPPGSLFYSVHGQEDSLYFFSAQANYNLAKLCIKADSVERIYVADAKIMPKGKRVELDAKARIRTLKESEILANHTDRFHHFYDAEINISSRRRYRAKGLIDYVDERGDAQPIALEEITVDNYLNTFANTAVAIPDSFNLSPHFGFIGEISIDAKEQFWLFNGETNPIHSCPVIISRRVAFKATIDPNNVLIPMPERPINRNHIYLMSGSVISSDSIHLYPGLLNARKDYSDVPIIHSHGYMRFNSSNNRFQIGSLQKFDNPDTLGNMVALSKDLCMIFSEGEMNFPVRLGQLKIDPTGRITHNLQDSSITMDMVLPIDFHFNQAALEAMAAEILSTPGLRATDLNRRAYNDALKLRCAPNDLKAAQDQIKLFGTLTQVPKGLDATITLSDVRMRWDPANRSFVSHGQIGIGSLGNTVVNRRVDGFVEIIKRTSGDWMMIYIELAPNKYYSFYYNRGSMQVSSHSNGFTDPINLMKTRERRIRVRAGEMGYNFVVGTRRELDMVRGRYYKLTGRTPEGEEKEEDEGKPLNGDAEERFEIDFTDDDEPYHEIEKAPSEEEALEDE